MIRSLAALSLFFVPSVAWAVPVWPPMETKEFVERTKEIVIVRCLSPDLDGEDSPKVDGLTAIEVEVLAVVKGERKLGKAKLATIGTPMEKGKRYLMGSFGGSFGDINFVAQSDQAVTEIPASFDLKSLNGKKSIEQVQAIFDARRRQVEWLLLQLQREKEALKLTAPK